MKKIISPFKNQLQTFSITKACPLFLLLFAGIFIAKAQKAPLPLSVFSKDYQPNHSNTVTSENPPPAVHAAATGVWKHLPRLAPHYNFGGMLLLSDGTVLCKSGAGGVYGTIYDRLTPD